MTIPMSEVTEARVVRYALVQWVVEIAFSPGCGPEEKRVRITDLGHVLAPFRRRPADELATYINFVIG